jgi:copper(I)-binding protein
VNSSKSNVQSTVWHAAIAAVLLFACTAIAGQDKGVKASNGWVKLPAPGESQAMAFVTVENPGMYEVNITSASADAGGKVELRDAAQTVTFINVPPYGRVDMAPTSVHLMLIGVKRPIKEGDAVTLTLSTDSDITLTVAARVRTN